MISCYSIYWKYTIDLIHKNKFELAYGAEGVWNQLFSKSENYLGSTLHSLEDEPNTYLLVDCWVNKATYEAFKSENAMSYNMLSDDLKYLYLDEQKVGAFTSSQ